MTIENEKAIRAVVSSFVEAYASGFSDRHLSEVDDEEGTINMKIHNVFIAALGADIQYYSALARSLDSSLGNMLEKMAIKIASLHYEVSQHVEGSIYPEQTEYIATIWKNINVMHVNQKLQTMQQSWRCTMTLLLLTSAMKAIIICLTRKQVCTILLS